MGRSSKILAALLAAVNLAAAAALVRPVTFEEQWDTIAARTEYLARGPGYLIRLERHRATLASQDGQVIQVLLAGARDAGPVGVQLLPGRSNYLIGPDPAQWRIGITNYNRVEYSRVYPGIDLVWHGSGGEVENDFVVAPGANPHQIRLVLRGAAPRLHTDGDLAAGRFLLHKPQAWQDGHEVECGYQVSGQRVRLR